MTDEAEIHWRDYAATLATFSQLADIRFKLLTLVPIGSGLAVALISSNVDAFLAQPVPRMLGGVLGFLVTLGLTFYDQRNSQLYNALFIRAANLEKVLPLSLPGQLSGRPQKTRRMFGVIEIWHQRGLALIYGAALGAWAFPVIAGFLWLMGADKYISVPRTAALGAGAVALLFIGEIERLDRQPVYPAESEKSSDAGAPTEARSQGEVSGGGA